MDYNEIKKLLEANQLEEAIQIAKNELKNLPLNQFQEILEINWLALSDSLTDYIDKFYRSSVKKIKRVEAIYCEMNAFTINHDAWFVQFFAYSKFLGKQDYDWLAEYDYSTDDNALCFTRLETIQSVFKDYMDKKKWQDKQLEQAFEISEVVIILGVQDLFKKSSTIAKSRNLKWAEIPLLVTAHDYDLIFDATQN